jgi:hypothetical protein
MAVWVNRVQSDLSIVGRDRIVDVDLAMLQNTLLDKYDSGSPSQLPIKLP